MAAFPQFAVGVGDGEALVFGRDSKSEATLVARIKSSSERLRVHKTLGRKPCTL